jgi:hypothetical protein
LFWYNIPKKALGFSPVEKIDIEKGSDKCGKK